MAPRTKLGGKCTADSKIVSFERYSSNKYKLVLKYKCKIHTDSQTKIVELETEVNYIIRIHLNYETLDVRIESASAVPSFSRVGNFVVENFPLAQFKMNQVLSVLKEYGTFGTGFPTWPRDHPNVEVNSNYTFFYDSSHIPHEQNQK